MAPDASSPSEERRFLITLAIWFLVCGFLGAALLIVSIWVDWV